MASTLDSEADLLSSIDKKAGGEVVERDSVVAEGPIQVEDSLRAARFKHRRQYIALRIVGLTFLVLGITFALLLQDWDPLTTLSGLLILLMPNIQIWRFKRMLLSTPSLYGHHVMTFADDGFHAHNPHMDSHQPWSYFTSFQESEDDFLLISGKAMSQAVPKHLFESDEQILRVRELLSAHIVGPPKK